MAFAAVCIARELRQGKGSTLTCGLIVATWFAPNHVHVVLHLDAPRNEPNLPGCDFLGADFVHCRCAGGGRIAFIISRSEQATAAENDLFDHANAGSFRQSSNPRRGADLPGDGMSCGP